MRRAPLPAKVVAALGALLAACGSGGSPPGSPKTARAGPTNWCGAVDQAIGSGDARGFHCLKVPNFLITGFYGPERNPERSDFVNACFTGNADAAKRLRMNVRPIGNLSFHYSAKQSLDAGGGLDLSFLGPWAPKVSAKSSDADQIDIEVELVDAEIRVLSSVGEILGQEFEGATEGTPVKNALESCIHSVCDSRGEKLVYTAKVLAAIPIIRLNSKNDTKKSFELRETAASFTIDRARSTSARWVLRAKEKLNVAALLEAAAPAFQRSETCTRVRAARTRHEVLTGLREIGLRCLAGRAVDEVPTLATPLRKSTEGNASTFTSNERSAVLRSIEAIEGTARQLALSKPNNSLCAVRALAESVLAGPSEDNLVHGVVVDVIEPLHQRLTELANDNSLPCAEPVWFKDLDRDGYGDKKSSLRGSKQPPGYVANALDCYDENPEAKPGQTRFFPQHRGDGSFDFDCDGKPTRRDDIVSGGCREMTTLGYPTKCWADAGWLGGVPDCGQRGKWLSACEVHVLTCSSSQETRPVQECR